MTMGTRTLARRKRPVGGDAGSRWPETGDSIDPNRDDRHDGDVVALADAADRDREGTDAWIEPAGGRNE